MVAFHSPPEATPKLPDEFATAEEPTRPSTPSALAHPYRDGAPPVIIPPPPRAPRTSSPELGAFLQRVSRSSPPRKPIVDPWPLALWRFLGF